MDRAANLAGIRDDKGLEASWRTTADEIQADILKNGVNDKGVLKQHYATDDWLDASVLLTERPGLGHQHDRGRITLTDEVAVGCRLRGVAAIAMRSPSPRRS